MLANAAVFHTSGRCLLAKHVAGAPISVDELAALGSVLSLARGRSDPASVDGLAKGSEAEAQCSALSCDGVFVRRLAVGNLTLVAQSEEEGCEAVLDATLQNMRSLVIFFLGGFAQSSFEEDAVLGIADVLESFLSRLAAEPAILIAGPRVVALPPDTRMQMDELLASLEQNEVVRGTALLLGTTAVHSRMDASLLGHIQNALAARPLSPAKTRTFPAFASDQWFNVVVHAARSLTLVLLCPVKVPIREILPLLARAEDELDAAAPQLPAEEPSLSVRQFTTHDVAGFVYRNKRTGVVIAPMARSQGNALAQQRISSNVLRAISLAYSGLARLKLSSCHMTAQGTELFAMQSDSHTLVLAAYGGSGAAAGLGDKGGAQAVLAAAVAGDLGTPIQRVAAEVVREVERQYAHWLSD